MSGKNIKVALQITADLNQARLAIRGLSQDISQITGGMQSLQISQNRMSSTLDSTNAGMQRLSSSVNQQNQAVKQLIASTAAYFSVAKLISEADAYTSLNNRLKLVTQVQDNATQSQINLNKAMKDTFAIAQSAAADWGGVSSIYDKIYKNSERLGISQKQVATLTETVTKSISNSGSSAQAASAALYQLGQSFDKGSLNGDEFVSISENAGYVMDVLAKGLNVTRAELRQMSTDGKLTTDVMVKAFTNMHDSVNAAFGNTQTTIGGGFTMLSNALKKYVGEADQGVGATKVIVNALSGLASNFEAVINIMGLAVWGVFTQKMIAQAVAMKERVIAAQANRAAMLTEMQATVAATTAEVSRTQAIMQLTQWKLADARADMARMTGLQRLTFLQQVVLPLERQLTAATAAHTAAQAAQTAATNALTAAKNRLALAGSAVLGFFGGPLGLLVTGASVAAMYLLMRDNADEATKSLASQTGTVAELAKQYKQLSFTKLSSEMATIREDIKKSEKDIKNALSDAYAQVGGSFDLRIGTYTSKQIAEWRKIVSQVDSKDASKRISTDQALLDMKNAGFKKSDIDQVAKYFEKLNEGRSALEAQNQQFRLGSQLLGEVNDQFDQHNKSIEAQTSQVNVLDSEYSRLNTSFKTQIDYAKENAANNGITKKSVDAINTVLQQYNEDASTATKVAETFAKSGKVSPDVLKSLIEAAKNVDTKKKALDAANEAMKKTGENAPKTAKGFNEIGEQAKKAADEINGLSKEFQEYLKKTQDDTFRNKMEIGFRKQGYSAEQSKAYTEAYMLKNPDRNADKINPVTAQDKARIDANLKSAKDIADLDEQAKKSQEAKTKELEKQKQLALTQKAIAASSNEQTKNMLMVYQGFIKAGATDPMARYLTSEVGREGDFLNKNIFGSHQDKNNNQTNTGIISYQKDRSKELMAFLQSKGLLDEQGNIKQVQEAVYAQTEFVLYELLNKKEYNKSKNALLSGQAGYEDLQQIVGNNFIGWDIKGKKLSQKEVAKAQGRQNGYKGQLDQILGNDPSPLLGEFSKNNQLQDDFTKYQQQQRDNQKSIEEKYYTEDQRMLVEHLKNREAILKAGFDREKETELLLKEDQRYNTEKNKPRLDMLKDVQNAMVGLDQNYLQANNQSLQAELNAIDEKYKDLKTKIETLLQSTDDPVERKQLEDAQLKLNVVIDKEKVTADFNNVLSEYEKLQSLRQQRQDTLKLQNDSGQISQFQYADGLKAIDAEMKPALQNLIDQAAILAENMGDAFSVSRVEAMNAALNQTDGSFQKFMPTIEQIQERIAGGMTDAILDWADGTKSASEAFREFASSFLREIAQMILKQMIFNAVRAATGFGSDAIALLGTGFFATGGYTGAGGKYQPAGIVHKDEFVIRKESTSQTGAKEFLTYFNRYGMDALNKFNKGYADGGLVAAPNVQMPNVPAPQLVDNTAQIAQSTSFNASQNFYLVDDPARILDTLNSSKGQENIVVMMSRDPSKFKAALKIQG